MVMLCDDNAKVCNRIRVPKTVSQDTGNRALRSAQTTTARLRTRLLVAGLA